MLCYGSNNNEQNFGSILYSTIIENINIEHVEIEVKFGEVIRGVRSVNQSYYSSFLEKIKSIDDYESSSEHIIEDIITENSTRSRIIDDIEQQVITKTMVIPNQDINEYFCRLSINTETPSPLR